MLDRVRAALSRLALRIKNAPRRTLIAASVIAALVLGAGVTGIVIARSAPAAAVAAPTHKATARATATPTVTAAPAPTPTPTPTPTCTGVVGATLSVPSANINGPISEYTYDMAAAEGAVDPEGLDTIAWYSGIDGGLPTPDATNTTYIYGHSSTGWAVFNDVRLMQPGDTATVDICGQVVQYVMTDPVFTVLKPELSTDPRVTQATAGRLLLISCYRPDDYDPNAPTVENVVAVLQRVD